MKVKVPSYPDIIHLGSPGSELFENSALVLAQEKIDGSQFRWGIGFDAETNTFQPACASHHNQINPDQVPNMFGAGFNIAFDQNTIKVLKGIAWVEDDFYSPVIGVWCYGELLNNPRHNTLTYGRVPNNHIVLFDVAVDFFNGQRSWLNYDRICDVAKALNIEVVPSQSLSGPAITALMAESWFDQDSVLGNTKVEGIVFKAYDTIVTYGGIQQPLIAKWVSPRFKETNKSEWKTKTPRGGVDDLIASYESNEARWRKAIQHRAEAGQLTFEPKDIGPLVGAIAEDIFKEDGDEIKEKLYQLVRKEIGRVSVKGFAEWYKEHLAELVAIYKTNNDQTEPSA